LFLNKIISLHQSFKGMVSNKFTDIIAKRFSLKKKTKTKRKLSRSCSSERRSSTSERRARRASTTLSRRFSRRFTTQKKVIYKCETSIAVFGSSKVGKTTIVHSLADLQKFRKVSYRPTVTETHKRAITLKSKNGKICKHDVKLVDTSGKIRTDYFPTFDNTVKSCEAFIVVFSLDSEESLNEAELLVTEINRVKKSTSTPILFIATTSPEDCCTKSRPDHMTERIKKINRGLFYEKFIDDDEDFLDGFVSLLTDIERRKGIDRSFFGVEVM